ncbi:MAG: hypothetical protein CMH83_11920 [Nocardioides sp.]|nr:hypothetical protein [Nocardioides sp.]
MTRTTQARPATSRAGLLGAVTAVAAMAPILLGAVLVPASAQDVLVSPQPVDDQPRVMNGRVLDLDTHGSTVAVGGSFTRIRPAGGYPETTRQWLFVYDSTTGEVDQDFLPELRGPDPVTTGLVDEQPGVEAVAFSADGESLYAAGWFTSVNGTTANRVVKLDVADGSIDPTFTASVDYIVKDMKLVGDRLVLAGKFNRVNGQPVSKLVSLDPDTGATQTDFNLPVTESRDEYAPYVAELAASPDGRWLALSGSFEKVGTLTRNQLAVIDLEDPSGRPRVANWATDAFAGDCFDVYDDTYIHGLAIDPTSSFLVVSGTGGHTGAETMCDSVSRWELPPTVTGEHVQYTWKDITGGDTLWASYITDAAVYVGGHQRWMNNSYPTPGGDNDGPGSVVRMGMAALDPASGVPLSWNPGRDRGRGAEAITGNDQYVFYGHDTDLVAGEPHERLAAFPVAGGTAVPEPADVELPVQFRYVTGSSTYQRTFTGSSFGSRTTVNGGSSWSDFRGGFVQNGVLTYFGGNDNYYRRTVSGSSYGTAENLSESVGYVDTNDNYTADDQPWGVSETTAAAYQDGFVYYTKSNDDRLFRRGYSQESGILGSYEEVVNDRNWSGTKGLTFVGDWLYLAWSNGYLYRMYAPDGELHYDTATVVDTGSVTNWATVRGIYTMPTTGTANPPTAPDTSCSGSTPWRAQYWANKTLSGFADTTRCEASIDYAWGSGAPTGANVGTDNFSVAWTREVDVPAGQAVRISAYIDDGVRAYVDGVRVIDDWRDSSPATRTGTSQALSAGAHDVRVEMYENSGDSTAQVSVSTVSAPAAPVEYDNVPGNTTVTSPAAEATVRDTTFSATGTATDDRAVGAVRVAVYDRDNADARWLQSDGTFGSAYASRMASVASPGETTTDWSIPLDLPEGRYALSVTSVDETGNSDETPVWRQFTVDTTPEDTTDPTVAVTAPTGEQVVRTDPVTVTGTATDDQSVTAVRVAVYDRDQPSTPWQQVDGTFGAQYYARTATLASAGSTSTDWSMDVTVPEGRFAVDVKAVDAAGHVSSSTWRQFSVDRGPVDSADPTVTVSSPTAEQVVSADPFTVTGTASDDLSVASVRVAVYDRNNPDKPWLQADGTFGSAYAFRTATLASPGAASTSWTLSVPRPADGSYAVDVKPVDGKDNIGGNVWRQFSVDAAGKDTTDPDTTVTAPTSNQQVTSPFTITGTATDDRGVKRVRVAIFNKGDSTNRWLQADGSWGPTYASRTATLASAGAATTNWSLPLSLPAGLYGLDAASDDTSGNYDHSSVWREFQVGSDTTAPTARTTGTQTTSARSARSAGSLRPVTVVGRATDDESVRTVRVQVRKVGAKGKRFVQADGRRLGKRGVRIESVLADPGRRASRWTTSLRLRPGRYVVKVYSFDATLNAGRPTTRRIRVR